MKAISQAIESAENADQVGMLTIKQANKEATSCEHKSVVVRSDKPLKLKLANAGGYVGILTKVEK